MKQRKAKGSINGAKAEVLHWQINNWLIDQIKPQGRRPDQPDRHQNVIVFLWPLPTCPGSKGRRNSDGRRGSSSQHKRFLLILNPVRVQTAANAQTAHPQVIGTHLQSGGKTKIGQRFFDFNISMNKEDLNWTFTGACKAIR